MGILYFFLKNILMIQITIATKIGIAEMMPPTIQQIAITGFSAATSISGALYANAATVNKSMDIAVGIIINKEIKFFIILLIATSFPYNHIGFPERKVH